MSYPFLGLGFKNSFAPFGRPENPLVSLTALTAAEHFYDEGSFAFGYTPSANITTNVSTNVNNFNETWGDIPVVTASGKRLFVIIATWRYGFSINTSEFWSNQFNNGNYELLLKYNNKTTALTYAGFHAATTYSATSIWTGMADGAALATDDYFIQFIDLNNNSGGHGNFAFSAIVLDNVNTINYINNESLGFSSTVNQKVTSALNLAPNNATAAKKVLRIAASNASNIPLDNIDYNKGETEPDYIKIGEGDNGTNERHYHSYHFGDHNTQVNMTGTFGDGLTSAGDGISGLGCIIGLS